MSTRDLLTKKIPLAAMKVVGAALWDDGFGTPFADKVAIATKLEDKRNLNIFRKKI